MRLGAVIRLRLRGEDAADKPREVFHLLLERCCVSKHAQAGLWNCYLFLSHGLIETTEERKTQIQSMYRQLAHVTLGRNLALVWLLIKTQFKLRNTYLPPLLNDFSYLPIRGLIYMPHLGGVLCTVFLKLLVQSCYVTSSELL